MLLPVENIKIKRDGGAHSREELKHFIDGYLSGNVSDAQMSAWLMSVVWRGMNAQETSTLTEIMRDSGDVMDFSDLDEPCVDKHSTGGVGDKTSLILGPIVAALGVNVPMISGRGLGHTGGTLDKLESIPGFQTRLDLKTFKDNIKKNKLCFIGQTDSICPADKKIYSLRDVTGTIESLPLICASIMSKKLAEDLDGLVLDVKVGSGAFMKSLHQAKELAENLVGIGKSQGIKMRTLITDMDQPLGDTVGNAIEIEECLACLKGQGPDDTRTLSFELAAEMLRVSGLCEEIEKARKHVEKVVQSGAALEIFEKTCALQGGSLEKLPKPKHSRVVTSPKGGFIRAMQTEKIGLAAIVLGAGRRALSDVIDPTAGIRFHKKIGQMVAHKEPLITLYGQSEKSFDEVARRILQSLEFSDKAISLPTLIKERL